MFSVDGTQVNECSQNNRMHNTQLPCSIYRELQMGRKWRGSAMDENTISNVEERRQKHQCQRGSIKNVSTTAHEAQSMSFDRRYGWREYGWRKLIHSNHVVVGSSVECITGMLNFMAINCVGIVNKIPNTVNGKWSEKIACVYISVVAATASTPPSPSPPPSPPALPPIWANT